MQIKQRQRKLPNSRYFRISLTVLFLICALKIMQKNVCDTKFFCNFVFDNQEIFIVCFMVAHSLTWVYMEK